MRFVTTSYEQIEGDIANLDDVIVVPPVLLQKDVDRWSELLLGKFRHAKTMSFAEFFRFRARVVNERGEIILNGVRQGSGLKIFDEAIKPVASWYAVSRFVGSLTIHDAARYKNPDNFPIVTETKNLRSNPIDVDEIVDAYSLTLGRERLGRLPFEHGHPDLAGGEAWYVDKEAGLYVAVRPFVAAGDSSGGLLRASDGHIVSSATTDAQNSVTMSPYLSLAYLRNWQASF